MLILAVGWFLLMGGGLWLLFKIPKWLKKAFPNLRAGDAVYVTNFEDLDPERRVRDLALQAQMAALTDEIRRLRLAIEDKPPTIAELKSEASSRSSR
jgi:hypothetical protein